MHVAGNRCSMVPFVYTSEGEQVAGVFREDKMAELSFANVEGILGQISQEFVIRRTFEWSYPIVDSDLVQFVAVGRKSVV